MKRKLLTSGNNYGLSFGKCTIEIWYRQKANIQYKCFVPKVVNRQQTTTTKTSSSTSTKNGVYYLQSALCSFYEITLTQSTQRKIIKSSKRCRKFTWKTLTVIMIKRVIYDIAKNNFVLSMWFRATDEYYVEWEITCMQIVFSLNENKKIPHLHLQKKHKKILSALIIW